MNGLKYSKDEIDFRINVKFSKQNFIDFTQFKRVCEVKECLKSQPTKCFTEIDSSLIVALSQVGFTVCFCGYMFKTQK